MEKKLPPNETRYNDLAGVISLNIGEDKTFNEFAAEIAGYDEEAYEVVAMRVFNENSPVITIYARSKKESGNSSNGNKLRVHKFKKEIDFKDFFSKISEWNFTVTNGEYNIENMEVVNK